MRKNKNRGYDFACGQVLMATPYGQRQLAEHGVTPEDIRQALGFSKEFMIRCYQAALQAEPLKKDGQRFQDKDDFQEKMARMVPEDSIQRLGNGWMLWAQAQIEKWQAAEPCHQEDEAEMQAKLARGSQ